MLLVINNICFVFAGSRWRSMMVPWYGGLMSSGKGGTRYYGNSPWQFWSWWEDLLSPTLKASFTPNVVVKRWAVHPLPVFFGLPARKSKHSEKFKMNRNSNTILSENSVLCGFHQWFGGGGVASCVMTSQCMTPHHYHKTVGEIHIIYYWEHMCFCISL